MTWRTFKILLPAWQSGFKQILIGGFQKGRTCSCISRDFSKFSGGSYPEPSNQSDNGLQFLKFENVGEWFEYLWSTTRAIRKDITQQDLKTDPMAVDLVEKIARFHIMCAERLVEEESYNFDKKLNDENLTKCIQTLKHMYYDMSIEGRVSKLMEFQGNI